MPHKIERLEVVPLAHDLRKDTELGAEVVLPWSMPLLDLSALTGEDRETLRTGLFTHHILVIRNQLGLDPTLLPELAKIFDSTVRDIHSGGKTQVTDKKNILSQNNGSRIPRAPQVTVIGSGNTNGHQGIEDLELKHVDHVSFHQNPLTAEEMAQGYTRPYRWHMDAPLYENLPGFVTSLHSIEAPDLPDQKIRFPDGSEMDLAAGATAFYSGAKSFKLLTAEEQDFAMNTTVQYAPRAYEFIRHCKATDDGFGIAGVGQEMPMTEMTPFEWDKVHAFPMVWRNRETQEPHLQILGCNVLSLRTKNPANGETTVIDDLAEVRRICHGLQSKIYKPEHIYAHRWRKGDLVIFHNRGVLHSITGQLSNRPERRLLWQCSMASETPPVPYRT